MGLLELALKMLACLVMAGLLGWIIGFLLGRIFGSANASELLNECEGKMRMREQEMGGLRADLISANSQVSSLQTELATLATTLKTRDGWVTEMEGKNRELQADLDARIFELDELQAESEQAKSALTAQWEKALAEAEAETEALRMQVAQAEAAAQLRQGTEREVATLRASFAVKEQELAQAFFRLKSLEPLAAQVTERNDRIVTLEAAQQAVSKAKDDELAALKMELSLRVAKLTELQAALSHGQQTQRDLEAEIASLRQGSAAKESELLLIQVQESETRLGAMSAQAKSKDEEIAKLRLHISELEPLTIQAQQREAKVRDLDAQLQEWAATYTALGREKEQEMARLKVRITELEMMARDVKEPAVKVSPASALPPSPKEVDDLKRVYGIGPTLEQLLNHQGIYWFRQIANWTPEDIQHYDELLKEFHGRIEREGWIASARAEHFKKYNEQV